MFPVCWPQLMVLQFNLQVGYELVGIGWVIVAVCQVVCHVSVGGRKQCF